MDEPNLSDAQRSTGENRTLLAVACFALFLFEALMLYLFSYGDPTRGLSFRIGHAAIGGFWLTCGRPPWEIRVAIVVAATLLIGMTDFRMGIQMTTFMGITTVIVAGCTFLGRIVFSVVTSEASPHQRFSILGVMLATAGVAGVIVALRLALGSDGTGEEDLRIAITLMHLVAMGTVLVAQCSVWWARTWGMFWKMVAIAVLTAISVPLIAYAIHVSLDDNIGSTEDLLIFYWIASVSIWITLVPLHLSLKVAGTSLVSESWMQRESAAQHVEPDFPRGIGGVADE